MLATNPFLLPFLSNLSFLLGMLSPCTPQSPGPTFVLGVPVFGRRNSSSAKRLPFCGDRAPFLIVYVEHLASPQPLTFPLLYQPLLDAGLL